MLMTPDLTIDLDSYWYTMSDAETVEAAVAAFAAAMEMPLNDRVSDLVELHTEAKQMRAVLAKKEEGEKLMATGKFEAALGY